MPTIGAVVLSVALIAALTPESRSQAIIDQCRCRTSQPHNCYDIVPRQNETGKCDKMKRTCEGCQCDVYGDRICNIKEKLVYQLFHGSKDACHMGDAEVVICGKQIVRSAKREVREMVTECEVVGNPNYEKECSLECFPPHFGDLLKVKVETAAAWYNNVNFTNQGDRVVHSVYFNSRAEVKTFLERNGTEICMNSDSRCIDRIDANEPPYLGFGFQPGKSDKTRFTGSGLNTKSFDLRGDLHDFLCPGTTRTVEVLTKTSIVNTYSSSMILQWSGETHVGYKATYTFESF